MNQAEDVLKNEFGDRLKDNELLREYSTIGVGGVADFFLEVNKIEDLVSSVNLAYKNDIPLVVIGWGSNIIFSDFGFPGLVVLNRASNIVFNRDQGEVVVDSGISLGKLLNTAASSDLGGLEFLSGVPGTVGGAIYNNAGGKNTSIGDYVKSVTLLEYKDRECKIVKRDREWFDFAYRSTKLKNGSFEKQPIILTATLQLAHKRKDEILRLLKENIESKRRTQPIDKKCAGSFFKNLGRSKEESAGYLLDKAGAKKLRIGGARVSKKHANFIINSSQATARDIKKLADEMRDLIQKEYNIILSEEVEYLGKW